VTSKLKAHLALIAANVIYGLNYTIAKIALPGYIDPFSFVLIRVSLALLLFWMMWGILVREEIERKDIPVFMLGGLFGVAINQLLFFHGLAQTTEINASLIMITVPIIVLVLSHLLIREKITWRKISGITLAAIGAFLLIGFGQDFNFGSETMNGDLMILANASSYALYLVIMKPLTNKYNPLTVVSMVFSFGLIPVAFFGYKHLTKIDWPAFTPIVWFSVLYVVLATTVMAYLLNMFALKKVNPSIVSVYIYSQPLIATTVSVAAGNDLLTLLKVLAGMLIILGVFLTTHTQMINAGLFYKKKGT